MTKLLVILFIIKLYARNNIFQDLGSLPKNAVLCTINAIGLYPNIPHEEGLDLIRKHLDNRENKEMTTNTLVELAGIVLKKQLLPVLK